MSFHLRIRFEGTQKEGFRGKAPWVGVGIREIEEQSDTDEHTGAHTWPRATYIGGVA